MIQIAVSALSLLGLLTGMGGSGPSDGVNAAAAVTASATSFAPQPMVTITKSCPNLRYVGRKATFEITVANRGDGAARDVVVTDAIPSGIDFVSADNNGTRQGSNIVWRLGALNGGQTRTLKATFLCNRIGKYKNSATLTYCAEAVDGCELEVKGISAILLECVDSPDPIEVGGNVTYSITVANQGSAIGTNIAIECTLPAEQKYVSSDGPTTGRAEGQKVTFKPLPTLWPKAKIVYKLTAKGVKEGDVRFRVQMKSDQMVSPVMETESTHIY